ncbi:hypothetical protein M0R04_10375 [Candidatus Dojkabacteria bacterium]|jgi:hypothetical protein|nr:hypothetical protein [Candidatus Dojkabacteria bacterium]
MNKLDKELNKILDKHIFHEELIVVSEHIEQEWEGDVLVRKDLLVSQIKQSILKAIMEKGIKLYKNTNDDWKCKVCGYEGNECECIGFDKGIKEFESVIKEILK